MTAIDWLIEQIWDNHDAILDRNLIKQAKAMEKENSLDSFFAGFNYEGGHPIDQHEDYYKETYGAE